MTLEEVWAAARQLSSDDQWRLLNGLEHELAKTGPPPGVRGDSGIGSSVARPCAQNGWKWTPSADLLAEMQRLSETTDRREAS